MAERFTQNAAPATQPMPKVGETGSFEKITAQQGAVVTDRANAAEMAESTKARRRSTHAVSSRRLTQAARKNVSHREEQLQTNKNLFIGLGIAAAIIALTLLVIGVRAIRSLSRQGDSAESVSIERTSIVYTGAPSADDRIAFDGYSYFLSADEAGTHFYRVAEDDEPIVFFDVAGTPVSLILYDGAFIISENLDNTWDVMAYSIGDGSMVSELIDENGEPVSGEGSLVSAELEGSELVLSTDSGQVVRVGLA